MRMSNTDALKEARALLLRSPLAANGALISRLCDELEAAQAESAAAQKECSELRDELRLIDRGE